MCERVMQLINQYTDGLITEHEAWCSFILHLAECKLCDVYLKEMVKP